MITRWGVGLTASMVVLMGCGDAGDRGDAGTDSAVDAGLDGDSGPNLPEAPTDVVAVAGNQQASVSWTAPASETGNPITSYTVTASPGGRVATASFATQAIVDGLTNGTTYTFTVTATTIRGTTSPPSAPSNAVTPATVPDVPRSVSAIPGNRRAILSWLAPSSDGGSVITRYEVVTNPGGLRRIVVGGTSPFQATIDGLVNGTAYTFTVAAANALGLGPASPPSLAVTPAIAPSAPTAVIAIAGNADATVKWTAPADNGGAPILRYTVTSNPGAFTATGSSLGEVKVSGLSYGTSYTFTVTATNRVGQSALSAPSNSVTPVEPPCRILGGQPLIRLGGSDFRPRAVATADFNGDGKPDLVAGGATQFGYAVRVLLGNGNGRFQGERELDVGLGNGAVESVVTGDFNGDGKSDVAAASGGGTIFVFLGTGVGTFQPPIASPAGGATLRAMISADFNADGKLDVAIANSFTNSVGVLLGTGSGSFGAPASFMVGNEPYSVASGDFDADGKIDLVAANERGASVSVLLGNGSGAFATATPYNVGGGPRAIATGDLNADGRTDVVVANRSGNTVSVLMASAAGGFQAQVSYGVGSFNLGPYPQSVALTQLNGDSSLDLLVANDEGSTISVMLGNGDGTLRGALNYSAGAGPLSIITADFDADGKGDLALANERSSSLNVMMGNGDGTFVGDRYRQGLRVQAGHLPAAVADGDFNADGQLDLVVGLPTSGDPGSVSGARASVLLGNGNGTFRTPVEYNLLPSAISGTQPMFVLARDLNADGKLDLAVAGATTNRGVSVLMGNGDGSFLAGFRVHASLSDCNGIASGDFNTDGKVDLAIADGFNTAVLLGNGDGTGYQPPAYFGSRPGLIFAVDLNGDGRLDLVRGRFRHLGNGDGTFQAGVDVTTFVSGSPVEVTTVGDYNRDGKLDLTFARNTGAGVLFGNGDGTFSATTTTLIGAPTLSRDFNGDSFLDLFVFGTDITGSFGDTDGTVAMHAGNGDGTFQPPVFYAGAARVVGGGSLNASAGDFNGDGNSDIAFSHFSDLTLLLGGGCRP